MDDGGADIDAERLGDAGIGQRGADQLMGAQNIIALALQDGGGGRCADRQRLW